MSNTYSSMFFHLIWSTKQRYPFLTEQTKEHVYRYATGIIKNQGAQLLAIDGIEDHVHLLIKTFPSIAISSLVREIKVGTSKFVHEQYGEVPMLQKFSWQEGYGVLSVSSSKLNIVKNYIAGQEEHHKKMSFEKEYLMLLQKHGVIYDTKYVFG